MAKKQETKKQKVTYVEDTEVNVTQVVEQPKKETMVMETPKPKKDIWEVKDRSYYLTKGQTPLSKIMKSSAIYYFA